MTSWVITGHRRNLYFLPHTNSAGNRFWTSCGGLCPTFSNKWRSKGPVKKSWCPSEVWICPKATRFSLALRFTRHRRLASFFRLASLGVRIVVDLDQLEARNCRKDRHGVTSSPSDAVTFYPMRFLGGRHDGKREHIRLEHNTRSVYRTG